MFQVTCLTITISKFSASSHMRTTYQWQNQYLYLSIFRSTCTCTCVLQYMYMCTSVQWLSTTCTCTCTYKTSCVLVLTCKYFLVYLAPCLAPPCLAATATIESRHSTVHVYGEEEQNIQH